MDKADLLPKREGARIRRGTSDASSRLGLAQIKPKLGDVPANLSQHLEQIAAAAKQGVRLLMFPELSLTGYYLQDMVYEVAAHPTADDPTFGRLLAASREHDMDLTVGFVEEDTPPPLFYLAGVSERRRSRPRPPQSLPADLRPV